jgi:hypothetical protein
VRGRNQNKLRHGSNGCPAPDCNGGRSGRQYDLTPGQFAKLPADVAQRYENKPLRWCGYCDAVYEAGSPKVLMFLKD